MKSKLIPRKYFMGGSAPDGIYVEYPNYQVSTPVGNMRLGHGMVIAVDENTGKTRGSEYGRYDKENKGLARRVTVPDLQMADPGNPTKEELNAYANKLYNSYAKKHNKEKIGNKVKIHYVKGADENKMIELMKNAETNDRKNGFYTNHNYRILDHNCGTYGADMIKKSMPLFKFSGFAPYTAGTPSMVSPILGTSGTYKE